MLFLKLLLTLFAALLFGQHLFAQAGPLTLVKALRNLESPRFCGEPVNMDHADTKERFEKEFLLNLANPAQMILYMKRSGRFFPTMEGIIEQEGACSDLRYMAVIESALLPYARSPKGAVGFWQLMPATARKYGLRVDRFIDERRSIEPSTRAAVMYMKDLRAMFGSWSLAAAAYNMGEDGLAAEIDIQKKRDYFLLKLPKETERFLFRILAVKEIFEHRNKYGFKLEKEDFYKPAEKEKVTVAINRPCLTQVVAEAAGISFKRLKDLNPQLLGHHLPAGKYEILVPKGAAKRFYASFQNVLAAYETGQGRLVYIVRHGDNLSSIAKEFNVPLSSLLIWNRLDIRRPIYPGDRLVIYNDSGLKK